MTENASETLVATPTRAGGRSSSPNVSLLRNYVKRRQMNLFTRPEKRRHSVSRPATEEEQLFYAREKVQIAERMRECERESAELDVSLEEIHRSIAFYQESMQNVLDEQDKLETTLHECQQRELTFLEERTLLEEEYLSRLSSGLPNW